MIALLLTPGASASRDQPVLVAVDKAVSELGITVQRMDFPYRIAGRRAPDKAPVLVQAVRAAASSLGPDLFAGGRSMGGRICSIAVAEGLPSKGLVLISYPLHPPGKPQQLRVDHFPAIKVPCLFVSGTRDAFGTPEELEAHTAAIKGKVTHVWLEGKDHSLRGCDAQVAAAVTAWIKKRTKR